MPHAHAPSSPAGPPPHSLAPVRPQPPLVVLQGTVFTRGPFMGNMMQSPGRGGGCRVLSPFVSQRTTRAGFNSGLNFAALMFFFLFFISFGNVELHVFPRAIYVPSWGSPLPNGRPCQTLLRHCLFTTWRQTSSLRTRCCEAKAKGWLYGFTSLDPQCAFLTRLIPEDFKRRKTPIFIFQCMSTPVRLHAEVVSMDQMFQPSNAVIFKRPQRQNKGHKETRQAPGLCGISVSSASED